MQCASKYAPQRGRPSLPPGRYFRMLLIGYLEGIDSERGLEWRCADSLSLREFLCLGGTRTSAGSLLAEPHPEPSAARSGRRGVHLAELPKVPRAERVEWQRRGSNAWPSMG
jgi:Transposase domain (DUF772)